MSVFTLADVGFLAAIQPSGGPNFANVLLLLHMDGSNGSTTFTDSSSNNFTVTANGSAQITTTDPKYGTGALLLDGTNDWLSWPSDAVFNIGTGDFTLEMWAKSDVAFSAIRNLFKVPNNNATSAGLEVSNAGVLRWWKDGVGAIITGTTTLSSGTWYYIAVKRESGTLSLHLGTSGSTTTEGSVANSDAFDFSTWAIGANFYNSDWSGRIDEVRLSDITFDVSTVPTAPFPDS